MFSLSHLCSKCYQRMCGNPASASKLLPFSRRAQTSLAASNSSTPIDETDRRIDKNPGVSSNKSQAIPKMKDRKPDNFRSIRIERKDGRDANNNAASSGLEKQNRGHHQQQQETFRIIRQQSEENEKRLAQDPETAAEFAEFARQEQLLDEQVWGQLEKEYAVDELDESLLAENSEQNVEERLDQKEFEHRLLEPDLIGDPMNEPDLSTMETGEERATRPPNKFRKIVYTDELKHSDLSKPASPENPHPFDPEKAPLPPTHSRSLAEYANFVPTIQMLVELGIDLFEATQQDPRLGQALMNLNCEKQVKPKIYWLYKQVGVPAEELASYLTRNPYFLLQDLDELKARLNYLNYRRFEPEQIKKIVIENRYWLNHAIEVVDSRLGWIQRQFQLGPDEVRTVVVKEPKVIAFGTGPIGGIVRSLNDSCGFSANQLKLILLRDPRLFLCEMTHILVSYNYLAYVMRVDNKLLVEYPCAMRCHISGLRKRHEFLWRLGKANYVSGQPGYIPLNKLLHPSDRWFAENVAKVTLAEYNKFLKTI